MKNFFALVMFFISLTSMAANTPKSMALKVSCEGKKESLTLKVENAEFTDNELSSRLVLKYIPGEFAMLYFQKAIYTDKTFIGDVLKLEKNPCVKKNNSDSYFDLATGDLSAFNIYYGALGRCTMIDDKVWARFGSANLVIQTEEGVFSTMGVNRIVYSSSEECRNSYNK